MVGLPMAVLLASSLALVRKPTEMSIVPNDNRFVAVGELVTLQVVAHAEEPINVIGASLKIPEESLTVESVSKENSIITLWSEEPAYTNGAVHFSGGILSPSGFVGSGIVLTVQVRPQRIGDVQVLLEDVHMLAHDGTGSEVTSDISPITLVVRDAAQPSPDVNNDKQVNIFDLGLITANIFLHYEPLYDLNHDGKVSLADIVLIFQAIR